MVSDGHFDFVVIGAGFGGSIMSMILRRLGFSVLLIERASHPRFVIGESSTPFANLLLERIAEQFDLPVLKEFSDWGYWQARHADIPAGLKRGFSFFHHCEGKAFDPRDRETQLLVAASPNDAVADTHWYRPEFDAFLTSEAQKIGVSYLDRCEVQAVERTDRWLIRGSRGSVTCGFVVDATGANSAIARLLGIGSRPFETMPATRALYAHFRELPRLVHLEDGMPHPPEDAAVHHVFDGGWMWVLRFNNGITSAGFGLGEKVRGGWEDVLARYPALEAMFSPATPITPIREITPLSFCREHAAGNAFALLPSAAAFVDPLLSTGFALTLLGILRLASALESEAALREHEAQTFLEANATADLVSALYAKTHSFDEFSRLTILYFTAMSFTETCWRLGKEHLASGFLLTNNRSFSAAREQICAAARSGRTITRAMIDEAIEPFDIAGLRRRDRRNWHPVEFQDLIGARAKLGASEEEIQALLRSFDRHQDRWPLM